MKDCKVILSGIRPTGVLHLGNLFGAIQPCVDLSREQDNLGMYFIANLHGLTTDCGPKAAKAMKDDLPNMVLDFMAAGLDVEADNVLLYAQSSVPEIAELTWIFACLTASGRLSGMSHFAEKRDSLKAGTESATLGLLGYPVLMAADILGPKAAIVPVGEDQHQHVELARDLAKRFNALFDVPGFFPVPDLRERGSIRVPSLTGRGKMSKNQPTGCVFIGDDAQTARRKIFKTDKRLTDPVTGELLAEPRIGDEPGDPEQCRVFRLHQQTGLVESNLTEVESGCRAGTLRCGDCKVFLAEHVEAALAPIRARRRELDAGGGIALANDVLREHGLRARALIAPTVNEVKNIVGIPGY